MYPEYKPAPLQDVMAQAKQILKTIWEINERYLFTPILGVIAFSVIFHVVGALFPPIDESCGFGGSAHFPALYQTERQTDEPS